MSGRLRLSVGFSGSRESGGELMRLQSFVFVGTLVFCLGLASVCSAQDPAAPAAAPLSQPAITGPLSGLPPANFDAGLLGKNAVNRGVQVNQTMGKFTASLSWNDGFYSNRYSWLWGSLAYTNGPHTLSFVAGGNYKQTAFQSLATPLQNNSNIYNVIYTYNKNGWLIQPYFQYTNVPDNLKIGVPKDATTTGEALLISKNFKHEF